jgi:3'-phosphoadenosine 5'-phosphosulfate sulfotransferase (PAPS reductase)/FAD synthetase
MNEVRHILGISGGKDSAALAIYLNGLYPNLDIEYYTSDTGRELDETYRLIDRLESKMGRPIKRLDAVDLTNKLEKSPFDHFLHEYGGYLPSSTSRWCTKKLKLDPFEKYIGDELTISYVGIRGDEDREGYISRKQTVQSIFPFRRNIWSEDVNKLILANRGMESLKMAIEKVVPIEYKEKFTQIAGKLVSPTFTQKHKMNALLDVSVKSYNHIVFELLKGTDYPVGKLDYFPIIDNEENLFIDDIKSILNNSGVGLPAYYDPLEYEVEIDGEIHKGKYSRSRSGCFFCFYQQKIEWVWLYETHRDLFEQAMEYEKDGYSWMDTETLAELAQTARIAQIKKDHYLKMNRNSQKKDWKDQILDAEGEGCVSCFV